MLCRVLLQDTASQRHCPLSLDATSQSLLFSEFLAGAIRDFVSKALPQLLGEETSTPPRPSVALLRVKVRIDAWETSSLNSNDRVVC
jgi:hypothetical protein